jgi:holo-[acyl-carrier protein] synthase
MVAVPPATGARVGVDLVDVPAFQARLEGRDDLLADVFTDAELAYARSRRRPWPHLAARFAAKEATLKAIGTGLAGAMTWRDIEVTRDAAGTPGLMVQGATAGALGRQGLRRASVSLAHTRGHAIAVVLLTRA